MVAAGGIVPIGYYKDAEKSARTFRTIDGVRYSFPGDMAKVAADGSLILLGRGSQVINSGGEKIFPEEVEEAVKRVDGVLDCLVVGVDDERFGQAVTAVASLGRRRGRRRGDGHRRREAGPRRYKAPKRVVFVSQVPRAPNGKADYKAAKQLAYDALGLGDVAGHEAQVPGSGQEELLAKKASTRCTLGSSRCSVSTEWSRLASRSGARRR